MRVLIYLCLSTLQTHWNPSGTVWFYFNVWSLNSRILIRQAKEVCSSFVDVGFSTPKPLKPPWPVVNGKLNPKSLTIKCQV